MVWTLWGWHNLCRWESRVTLFCLEVARCHPDTWFLFASLLYQYCIHHAILHFEIVVLFQQVQLSNFAIFSDLPFNWSLGGRDLVLYDAHHHRAFARRVTQEQAQVLLHNRRHSSCPLCKQSLSESWAFVVEGYWDTWRLEVGSGC